MHGNKLYFVLLFVIILGAGSVRLLALSADPPSTTKQDFITDEAWWAHNARNHTLFGQWVLDDFNQALFAAPMHTAMIRLSFMCGGVSLAANAVGFGPQWTDNDRSCRFLAHARTGSLEWSCRDVSPRVRLLHNLLRPAGTG